MYRGVPTLKLMRRDDGHARHVYAKADSHQPLRSLRIITSDIIGI
jgi:hypothetical protein